MPIALVACERRRIYCSARSSTRNTEWRGDTVQVCAPPLRSSSLRERIWPSLGDRISRRTASTARSLLRRPTNDASLRRSSPIAWPGRFPHREGRGPTLPPGGPAPGSRAGAPLRLIHNSQFTIHMANPSYEHGRHTRTGSRCPREGSGQRRSGSVRNSPRASPATRSPAGAQKAQTTWPQPRQLWVAPTREVSDVPVGRRGRRGEHVHACRGMHAGAEACVRVVKEASDVPKAQTQMTSLPQTLHAFH
jgi:hypothetical protein